jgi:hypothetical protein
MENAGYVLTEIWKARPSWLEMTEAQRKSYLDEKINPVLMGMFGKGAELLGCAVNDNTGNEKMDYQFMAVWKFPNKELSDHLETIATEAGFLDYFEQVNFSGNLIPPPVLNDSMINL